MRLGFVFPGGGPEADYYGFERATDGAVRIYLANSRIGHHPTGEDHSPEALVETGRIDWIIEAAARLRPAGLDAIEWACTSGSFIKGRGFAEEQVRALSAFMGMPAGSTSLAFVAALDHLRIKHVGVLATYPEPASRAFAAFLEEAGISVGALDWIGAASGWDASLIPAETLDAGIAKVAVPGVDAVLIPDTALAALHLVDAFEQRIQRAVLTANAVTLWHALDLAGFHPPVENHGSLLAKQA